MNEESSRLHAIFTLSIITANSNGSTVTRKLNLVEGMFN
jgi:hypothetical protein